MNYKVDLYLQQGDTTGNKPVIDVIWNGNTVISSYTINKSYSTDYSDFGTKIDDINFITDNWNDTNTLEILYKNKLDTDNTNEVKIWLLNIFSSIESNDPGFNPSEAVSDENTEYMYVNRVNWVWSTVIVDGNEETADLNDYPDKKVFWPIGIKNANASITANSSGTVINSNSQPLSNVWTDGNAAIYSSYTFSESTILVN